MKKMLLGFLCVCLSIIVLMYFESFLYEVLNLLKINIYNYSYTVQIIINLIIKLSMCFLIYYIYKKDFRSRRRTNDGLIKKLLVFCVSLICLVVGIYLFKYIVKFIADLFDVAIIENEFYNIFNKKLDFNLIVKIINDYIIVPYLWCSVVIFGTDKLIRHNNACIIFSGIVASIISAFSITGTLGFVIINSLPIFLLFAILMYIYKKNYSIYFIISLYSFYLISNVFILNYLGW